MEKITTGPGVLRVNTVVGEAVMRALRTAFEADISAELGMSDNHQTVSFELAVPSGRRFNAPYNADRPARSGQPIGTPSADHFVTSRFSSAVGRMKRTTTELARGVLQ